VTSAPAVPAVAAADRTEHRVTAPELDAGHPCAQLDRLAADLVSERQRRRYRIAAEFVEDDVQVRVTEPSSPDTQQHFAGRRCRTLDLDETEIARPEIASCTHRPPSPASIRAVSCDDQCSRGALPYASQALGFRALTGAGETDDR
jgi:hypothetical protein